MTFHFDEFDVPAALDDAVEPHGLQGLTGCPIHKKIDAVCTDPNCPNNPNAMRPIGTPPPTTRQSRPADTIFRTDPKLRCIL